MTSARKDTLDRARERAREVRETFKFSNEYHKSIKEPQSVKPDMNTSISLKGDWKGVSIEMSLLSSNKVQVVVEPVTSRSRHMVSYHLYIDIFKTSIAHQLGFSREQIVGGLIKGLEFDSIIAKSEISLCENQPVPWYLKRTKFCIMETKHCIRRSNTCL